MVTADETWNGRLLECLEIVCGGPARFGPHPPLGLYLMTGTVGPGVAANTHCFVGLGRNVTSSDRRDGDSELIRPGSDLGRNTIGNSVKSTADAALSQIFYFKLIFLSNPISI